MHGPRWLGALVLLLASSAAAQERAGVSIGPQGDLEVDLFALHAICPGDTLRLEGQAGQLLQVQDGHYLLRPWTGRGWGTERFGRIVELDPLDLSRSWLIGRRKARLDQGDLVVEVRRRRDRAGLRLDLQLVHSHPAAFLVGVDIELGVHDSLSDLERANRVSRALETPPLLAGELHDVTRALNDPDALDARLLRLTARLLPFSDPAAKDVLVASWAGEVDASRRGRILQASAASGDEDLLRALVGVAHRLLDRDDGQRARAALQLAGPALLDLLCDDLSAEDDALPWVRLTRGALVRSIHPRDRPSREYRESLIDLLALAPDAWGPRHRQRLFGTYRQRPALRPAVVEAFSARPADALACLLEPALRWPRDDESNDAADLLSELEGLTATIHDALVSRGLLPPTRRVPIRSALAEAVARVRQAWEVRRDQSQAATLAQARRALSEGRHADTLNALRPLTAELPGHHPAFALLARALIAKATDEEARGALASATASLHEALRRSPEPEVEREARARLARLHLDAAALDLVSLSEGGRASGLSRVTIEETLDRILALDPGRRDEVLALRGQLWLGEARRANARGDHAAALQHLERAGAYVSLDGTTWLAWTAWLRLNLILFLTATAVCGSLVGLAVFAWRQREVEPPRVPRPLRPPPRHAVTPPSHA
jgi:tetratricopeptide (TPR) repeat protein